MFIAAIAEVVAAVVVVGTAVVVVGTAVMRETCYRVIALTEALSTVAVTVVAAAVMRETYQKVVLTEALRCWRRRRWVGRRRQKVLVVEVLTEALPMHCGLE